jgi:hypothetical protein
MTFVKSPLERYARSLPPAARTDFLQYCGSRRLKGRGRNRINRSYWRGLPLWLFEFYRENESGRALSHQFLNAVRWAQQCLFLAIRIKDDIFDGDATSPALLYISDQLLIEADHTISRQMDRSSEFWDVYSSCLLKTTGSILEVDELQRKAYPDLRELEEAYAGVNALFKIGPAAICSRAKRMKDFPSIARFCDEMAVVGQIVDDMRDLEEDFARHRFNFVASFFLGRRNTRVRRKQTPIALIQELFLNGSLTELFQHLHHRVDCAEGALAKLKLPGAAGFLEHYRDNLRHMEGHLSRRQVDFIVNALV